MADQCTVAGIVGKRGSGKSTLLKSYIVAAPRSIVWDWKGEYGGHVVTSLSDIPSLFDRPRFRAVYRAPLWGTVKEFDALCHVLLRCGSDFLFSVDEAATVCRGYAEGGLGQLLRLTRSQAISIVWATQKPTRLPSVYLSELNRLHCFHLHGRHDLIALSDLIGPEDLKRVAALPPHQHLTLNL